MSQAPMDLSEDPTTVRNTAFRMANKRQSELVRSGVSQSGHERNCCFLNTGTERFANISSAAGLDHIGDGRAYATTDWDHDGDLDLWLTNRNSPRVMFLRNNQQGDNHFIALRLKGNGTTTNRDAIGARVKVDLAGDNLPIVKTLRAGEGFLSQSSKVLHFGLGKNDQIDRISIRWPGGDVQQFTGLQADRTYQIVQGNDQAEVWERPTAVIPLEPSTNGPLPRTDVARIPLRFPIPLPALNYKSFEGQRVSLDTFRGSPTFVNLWASWCHPCLAELAELREYREHIRKVRLNVVALSIDGLAEDEQADPAAAQQLLEQLDFPFEAGMADKDLVDTIELVFEYLFDHRRRWAVPTSILLNSEGRLAAIYIGRVGAAELLSDVEALQSKKQTWHDASLPFRGHWAERGRRPDMWPFIETLLDEKRTAEALEYFTRLKKLQARTDIYSSLLVRLAASFREEGDAVKARQLYQQVVEADPKNVLAHAQLGVLFFDQGENAKAKQHARKAIRLDKDDPVAHFIYANVLLKEGNRDQAIGHYEKVVHLKPQLFEARMALGSAYAAKGQLRKAIVQYKAATQINPDESAANYQLALALQKIDRPKDALPVYEIAMQLNPPNQAIHYSYGTALVAAGQADKAVKLFRESLHKYGDSLQMINGLAWLLATNPDATSDDSAKAVSLAEKAGSMTDLKHAQILDTLGAAYAASGNFEKAVVTAERALARAEETGSAELADQIRMRLNLYRQGKPYRESPADH